MAIAVIGFGLVLSFFALQWYMEKKVDEEESRAKERRDHRYKGRHSTKR
jgi:hypothetical protein